MRLDHPATTNRFVQRITTGLVGARSTGRSKQLAGACTHVMRYMHYKRYQLSTNNTPATENSECVQSVHLQSRSI